VSGDFLFYLDIHQSSLWNLYWTYLVYSFSLSSFWIFLCHWSWLYITTARNLIYVFVYCKQIVSYTANNIFFWFSTCVINPFSNSGLIIFSDALCIKDWWLGSYSEISCRDAVPLLSDSYVTSLVNEAHIFHYEKCLGSIHSFTENIFHLTKEFELHLCAYSYLTNTILML
jgi:hypothetical protein